MIITIIRIEHGRDSQSLLKQLGLAVFAYCVTDLWAHSLFFVSSCYTCKLCTSWLEFLFVLFKRGPITIPGWADDWVSRQVNFQVSDDRRCSHQHNCTSCNVAML